MKASEKCEVSGRRRKCMKNKCKYCNKEIAEQETYCSIRCKTKAEEYYAFVKKHMVLVLVLVVIFLLIIFAQIIFFRNIFIITQTAMFGLGLTIFIFPFGNSVDSLGVKRSVIIVRGLAIIMMIIGLLLFPF